MRSEAAQQQAALAESLANEAEVELLEVAQPAVDLLARLARRPRGEVTCLDKADAQTAGRCIESGARASHAAANDQHVERFCRHAGQCVAAGLRPQLCAA
jgi:hypothetical protein